MANEDSAIREVDQELAEERQWARFRKHGPVAIGAAIAIVLGVAGWQGWSHMKTSNAQADALEYINAVELLEEDENAGRVALEGLAADQDGYGVLASFQRAGSFAANGERLKALEIYRGIANGAAPKRVKELARLRAGYLALADGRDAVIAELGGLPDSDGVYGYHAKEIMALAALDAEDYETALSNFRSLSIDVAAPEGVRSRAEEFAALASAGKAGVNITGEARVEDLLDVLGEETPVSVDDENSDNDAVDAEGEAGVDVTTDDAGAETSHDDHDGHDHEE